MANHVIGECAFCGRKSILSISEDSARDVDTVFVCGVCAFGFIPCAVCETPTNDTICKNCKTDGYIVCSTCGAIYASLFCPNCKGGEE
jgi:hypothetical protein